MTEKRLAVSFLAMIGLSLLAYTIFLVLQSKDYDCVDFKSQSEAQVEFKKHPTDIYHLDANHNGIACEILP